MARLTKKKKLAAIGATAAIALGSTGVAYAYFTSTGTGTGTATTGTSSEFNVSLTNSPAGLTPGGPIRTVNFTVKNLNSGHQQVSSAVASVTGTNKDGCDDTDFAITGTTVTPADLASNASTTGSFQIQMIDKNVGQDACKDATVDLEVKVS